jgi:hypothetical protein
LVGTAVSVAATEVAIISCELPVTAVGVGVFVTCAKGPACRAIGEKNMHTPSKIRMVMTLEFEARFPGM